jgi:phosphatidate cytidylyltransferase
MNIVFKDLSKRLFVSLISLTLIGIFIYLSQNKFFMPILALLLTSVALVGLYEYIKMIEKKNIFLNKWILFFSAFILLFSFYLYSQINGLKILPIFVFFFASFVIFISKFNNFEGAISYLGLSLFGLLYIVIPLGLLFPILYFKGQDGRLWLVYLISVTKIADVGGYFGGKLFGKHKLAPKLSPNKTVEGAIIGFFCSVLLSFLFYNFFRSQPNFYFSSAFFVLLGAIFGVLSQVGDLAESLLKRDAGIKDSNSIPGLGGILDMIDSLLFNIPILFFLLEGLV